MAPPGFSLDSRGLRVIGDPCLSDVRGQARLLSPSEALVYVASCVYGHDLDRPVGLIDLVDDPCMSSQAGRTQVL